MSTTEVTDATFSEVVLAATRTIIVDFWAPWCGPCRALTPVLEEIAAEHADSVTLVTMNVDAAPETASRYRITAVPTVAVFRTGKIAQTLIGAVPKRQVQERLAPYLTKVPARRRQPR